MRLAEAIEGFLRTARFEYGYSPHTIKAYRGDLRSLAEFVEAEAPGGEPGYPSGWYNAAIHSVLVAFVVLVACIIDLPTPQQVTDRGEDA